MCCAFPLLFAEKQRLCTFYNKRERFRRWVINHLILSEDYEETVESDRKNGRNTASEDRIFREEKCRHVKFRKKLQTVANGPDSCYLKKRNLKRRKRAAKKGFQNKNSTHSAETATRNRSKMRRKRQKCDVKIQKISRRRFPPHVQY